VPPQVITVDFPVDRIDDWINLQNILKTITYISDVKLEKMNIQNYHFSFTSKVSVDDLKILFERHGFSLIDKSKDSFILTKSSFGGYTY
jgi:hypothetical protein